MTSIEVVRGVAADPSSVALVLAGPAARELWPGEDATTVTVDPPRRTGVGFTARVLVRHEAATIGAGRISIRPSSAAGLRDAEITLVLTARDDHDAVLRCDAARYLDNVVRVSRERSSAA